MQEITVHPEPFEPLEGLLEPGRGQEVGAAAARVRERLAGATVWNVSSTATGGGVAEMLPSLLGLSLSADVDARWLVIDGDPDFFVVTKRLHNALHGSPGDGGSLDEQARAVYDATLAPEASALGEHLRAGDVVVLHDPQTAGLVGAVLEAGAVPVWRCHIGLDGTDEHTDAAWAFLRPDVERAAAVVMSRQAYVQGWMDADRVAIIAPAVDPFAVKNVPLEPAVVERVLVGAGVLAGEADQDGEGGTVPVAGGDDVVLAHRAEVVREGVAPDAGVPLVVQVSRWDRLKDMPGVLEAFADHVVGERDGGAGAHLLLVGPSVAGVTDDPEGAEVLAGCERAWRALPEPVRRRCSLVTLPMDDARENAVMVNALQRHAAVVVQKSLVEGFGLTVAEAMWKGRAVVASAVGGINDQVEDGVSGRLVDPTDGAALGAALRELLDDGAGGGPGDAAALGEAARARVRSRFLPDRQLLQWAELLAGLPSPDQR